MKKLLISLTAILLSLGAWAVPARPGAFTYTQPDGSVIRLERHGDEFFSWTTLAGTDQVVKLGADGFWRNSAIDSSAQEKAMAQRRRMNAQRAASIGPRTHTDNIMTHGARHIPVFLVNFQDVSFSIDTPREKFSAMLNEHGYSDNGGTGSARDYFMDNSHGQFTPVFDVYGPVTLPETMVYYGANEGNEHSLRAEQAAFHAARLLDASVDFSQYDNNNDGKVDMLLFYYAGYNEAEGGPEDSIWPHQWTVQGSSLPEARTTLFDGLRLGNYFCTSELRGNQGLNMCGIGTTCHEFGHSLGLPDFYDTDYDKNGRDHGLTFFSIMSNGSYNNNGRTPPYYNAEERILLGWMTGSDLKVLLQGNTAMGSIKDDTAFISPTETEGEYFLYECRDGSGWDAPLPAGLTIYHVDKSTSRTVGGMSPYMQWKDWSIYNTINAYGDHPCFYIIPASDPGNLNYKTSTPGSWIFPGSSGISVFSPTDWNGDNAGVTISGITYSDGKVSFTSDYSSTKVLKGSVTDLAGNGIEGVKLILSKKSKSADSPRLSRAKPRSMAFEAVTDVQGSFSIVIDAFDAMEGHLSFIREGYQSFSIDVSLNTLTNIANATMLRNGETELKEIYYYDPEAQEYVGGVESLGNSQMAAIKIPASELNPNGGRLLSVDFYACYPAEAYYLIVDAGKERLHTVELPDLREGLDDFVHIDLDGQNLTFPGGTDLYVGYAVKNAQVDYTGCPFVIASGSNTFYAPFDLSSSNWSYTFHTELGLVFSATVALGKDPDSFGQIGIPAIADPGCGSYKAGETFPLQMDIPFGMTASSVTWRFDGNPVTAPVTLNTGTHTVCATVIWPDGSTENFELEIHVQ